MKIEIRMPSLTDICPYCLGSGKLKAMQSAMTYNARSVRTNDITVKCNHCDGFGYRK